VGYPIPGNDAIVHEIAKSALLAAMGVPVMFYAAYGLIRGVSNGNPFRAIRCALLGAAAFGWIFWFIALWALPRSLPIDFTELSRGTSPLKQIHMGFLECNLTLRDGTTAYWEARKVVRLDKTDQLWLEGNAESCEDVSKHLRQWLVPLSIPAPSADTLKKRAAACKDNTIPIFTAHSPKRPMTLMVFLEPNGFVTPCLLAKH
jgi:hypothetical protein